MSAAEAGVLPPELAIALIGALGVGAQWLAWRLQMPAIVLMLLAGLVVGPGTGLLVPDRDIGALVAPMVAIAVAIILFEGGLTLNVHGLGDAQRGVMRLVVIGAPLGWALSAAALYFVAGLDLASAAVFGGIMIVTGPTVIAPLLRQARLARRPAALLQWEAIVNDPIGALAAVLAFEVVLVLQTDLPPADALLQLLPGIAVAGVAGVALGRAVVIGFRRGWSPEYMKVPILFVLVLALYVATNTLLEESGLLAVTAMGLVIANSDLPSFTELRRFKEHATVLLVSGVFILLAASMDVATLALLDWRALAFVLVTIALVRPVTVLVSLAFSNVPRNERILLALTGPRGVVLVAVAGLFGEKLSALGVAGGPLIAPLAFALVAGTVVLHGFTLAPLARALGLAGSEVPGLLVVGGSRFTAALASRLKEQEVPVLVADPNWYRLGHPRRAGVPIFYGDILSEAAEARVELVSYGIVLAATSNDAYNTLVTTDLAPEFGRENVWQLPRAKDQSGRHMLPASLGGRRLAGGAGFFDLDQRMERGWRVRVTRLTDTFDLADWRAANPEGVALGRISSGGALVLMPEGGDVQVPAGARLLALVPPEARQGTAPGTTQDAQARGKHDARAREGQEAKTREAENAQGPETQGGQARQDQDAQARDVHDAQAREAPQQKPGREPSAPLRS